MYDEMTIQAATSALNEGKLEDCGKLLGLDPVAVKYGHEFDESPNSYKRRLQAALGLPQDPEEKDDAEDHPARETHHGAAHGRHEAEDDEEEDPEDDEHPPGHPSRRRRKRR